MLRWVFTVTILLVCALARGEGKDFHDQDLTRHSFAGESLNGANFSNATLVECNFTQASVKRGNFKGAILTYATFHDTDLSEADFTGANCPGQVIQFSTCNLTKAHLEGLNKNLNGLCFRYSCSLKQANLKKSKIQEISSNCKLLGTDLRGANLRAVTFYPNSLPVLTGALYDDDTAFPEGFDPKAAGMILRELDKADEKPESKK